MEENRLFRFIETINTEVTSKNAVPGDEVVMDKETLFQMLYVSPCRVCGEVTGVNYAMRIDNTKCYCEENCLPVCPRCFSPALKEQRLSVRELKQAKKRG